MRTKIEWRSASKENYSNFCKSHPEIKLSFLEWKNIIYVYNDYYRNYILETGDRVKMPFGFGDFSIIKKKRQRKKVIKGVEYINLSVNWQESKRKGKRIYNFNHHTDGFFFGWHWFKASARFKHSKLWYFKPSRTTSRLINHYVKTDKKYQYLYKDWK